MTGAIDPENRHGRRVPRTLRPCNVRCSGQTAQCIAIASYGRSKRSPTSSSDRAQSASALSGSTA